MSRPAIRATRVTVTLAALSALIAILFLPWQSVQRVPRSLAPSHFDQINMALFLVGLLITAVAAVTAQLLHRGLWPLGALIVCGMAMMVVPPAIPSNDYFLFPRIDVGQAQTFLSGLVIVVAGAAGLIVSYRASRRGPGLSEVA